MRAAFVTLSILLCTGAAFASEIREFDLKTIERLGNEIADRDVLAAHAADAVLETQPLARSLKMRGWITELRTAGDRVYLILETSSGPNLAYIVTFHGLQNPQVEDHRGDPLPPNIAIRYKARNTAMKALKGKLYNIKYNFEVLQDPDGDGFLVYALGATTNPDEVVMGGHFRVTVSADGENAERVDALSKTLVVNNKKGPTGTPTAALWMVQLVSSKPVETLVYTSRLANLPIIVATNPGGRIWEIANGEIKDTGKTVGKK